MAAFCEQCGTALPADARFCEMCGHPVQEPAPPDPVFAAETPEPAEVPLFDTAPVEEDTWSEPDYEPLFDEPATSPSRRRWLAVGAVLTFLLVAGAFWMNRGDGDEAVYQPFWQGTPVFADDFSDPGSGWEVWQNEQSSARYEGGQLHLTQRADERMSVSRAGQSFENLALEVEAAPRALPPGSSYGLLVAYDGTNYTQLAVSEQGAYRILRVRGGSAERVAGWTPVAGLQENGVTRLGALRDGRSLVFSINGRPLPESVADLPPGDIALFVAKSRSGTAEEAHVAFDNVKVWIP